MDANQRAHYESIAKAALAQQANFETLYKKIFPEAEMVLKPVRPGYAPIYASRKQQKEWQIFRDVTRACFSRPDGLRTEWRELSLTEWLCSGVKFTGTPKVTFQQNLDFTHTPIFERA